jgi:DNA-binding MarR family transcriptional regulator
VKRSPQANTTEVIAEAFEQAACLTVRHMSGRPELSLTAALALGRLNLEGPVRLTALAAAEGISQPAMTDLIQRLERRGLVTRINDPEDGRVALVDVTDAGRALLDDRRRDRQHHLAELLTALSPEDQATLTLAMQVALPMIRRLVPNAASPPRSKTGISRSTSRGHKTRTGVQHDRKRLENN